MLSYFVSPATPTISYISLRSGVDSHADMPPERIRIAEVPLDELLVDDRHLGRARHIPLVEIAA